MTSAQIEATVKKYWARLATLPSTNFKTAAVVGLDYLTFFWLILASLMGKDVNLSILGAWLAFLASLHGVAYASFAKQRTTDYGALDRQAEIERAKASTPPAAPTTNLTVGAAVTQQQSPTS